MRLDVGLQWSQLIAMDRHQPFAAENKRRYIAVQILIFTCILVIIRISRLYAMNRLWNILGSTTRGSLSAILFT